MYPKAGGNADNCMARLPIEGQEYFHGYLVSYDVGTLLINNGDFLVRISENAKGEKQFVLSVMYDKEANEDEIKVLHFPIQYTSERKQYYIDKLCYVGFNSIIDLVNYYTQPGKKAFLKNPKGGDQMTCCFKTPIGRQRWELRHEDIIRQQQLGQGAFGEVWKGILYIQGKPEETAIKIAKSEVATMAVKGLMKEARFLRNFEHPNIVKLYGVAISQEPFMLVMEYIAEGALDAFLRKNGRILSLVDKSYMCCSAAWGLEYLHSKDCIHRDIAARNCLVAGMDIKISDFGLSHNGKTFQQKSIAKLPVRWMAPENMKSGAYSDKSDVYAFGVLCWEVYENGAKPFTNENNNDVVAKVTNGIRVEFHRDAPSRLVACISKHAFPDAPEDRWTMEEIAIELERSFKFLPPSIQVHEVRKKKRKVVTKKKPRTEDTVEYVKRKGKKTRATRTAATQTADS